MDLRLQDKVAGRFTPNIVDRMSTGCRQDMESAKRARERRRRDEREAHHAPLSQGSRRPIERRRNDVSDRKVLQLGQDLGCARVLDVPEVAIDPRVGVPAGPLIAHLHEPRPHVLGGRADRDRVGRLTFSRGQRCRPLPSVLGALRVWRPNDGRARGVPRTRTFRRRALQPVASWSGSRFGEGRRLASPCAQVRARLRRPLGVFPDPPEHLLLHQEGARI